MRLADALLALDRAVTSASEGRALQTRRDHIDDVSDGVAHPFAAIPRRVTIP